MDNTTTDESIRSEEPPHGRLLPRGTSSARILAAVFLSVMVALSGYTYWNDFQVATSRSADLMQALTKAADEQINGSLRTIDLLLQHVGNYLAASDVEEPRAIYQALHLQARAFPEVRSLFVADSSGMLRGDPDGQRSVAHRAYFRLQAQLFRLNQVVIDGPHVEDEGDEPQIILSRPITASDGSFKGIVGAVLSTSFFSDPLKLVGLDGEGTAMLLNTNGVVLARFPASPEWVGRSLAQTRLMAREMTHHPDGVFRSQGDMGSIDQVISYRLLENYPLVVATGIPMEGISSRWWETTRLKVAIELALAVILFMLAHNLDGRERQRRRAAEAIARMNVKLEHRVAQRTTSLRQEIAERIAIHDALLKIKEDYRQAKETAEQASLAKSRFLAAASHDLRQPVQALNLYINVLSTKPHTDEVSELVSNIRRSALALGELLNSLLDISRLDAGVVRPEPQPFCLGLLLERLWYDFMPAAEAAEVSVSMVVTREWCLSDPTLVARILQNLIGNAIRYAPRGKVVVGCRRRGNHLVMQVWDNGIGIAAHQRGAIFEEFYQIGNSARDRSQGLGLGLAIVRRLGELLDLKVSVRSELGRGSMFEFPLPRIAAPPRALPPPMPAVEMRDRSILVLDDAEDVRHSLCLQLKEWGHRPLGAESLAEGLDLVERGARPDLIIADYRLGEDDDGISAVTRLLRQSGLDCPVVLLTGDTAPDRLREATSSRFHLLHKPVQPEELHRIVGMLLAEAALAVEM